MLILLCIQCMSAQGQSQVIRYMGEVSYDRTLNFDGTPVTAKYILLFGADSSIFFETEVSEEDRPQLVSNSDNEVELSYKITFKSVRHILTVDFVNDSIHTQMALLNDGGPKPFLIKEKRNDINWKIDNEFNVLSGIRVQKATCEFRGRKYVVWFAPEIPTKAGPFKFNGLPGLILSVTDERNEVVFHATSVKVPLEDENSKGNTVAFRQDARRVTLGEYLELFDQQGIEFEKFIKAKLPRGARMELKTSKPVGGIELEYEDEALR